ncbi:MAG: Fe-S cluster assembly ATPase SufC [bacterium]|nr:Fe-S cluster assembly ATPase SufC [bacterium]
MVEQKILNVRNLSVETQEKVVVSNVSLEMKPGKISMLMGPNGSGKSSLLKGIFGHPKYKITEGTITLNGRNITKITTEKKAKLKMFFSMQYLPEVSGVTLLKFIHTSHQEITGKNISVLEFYKTIMATASLLEIPDALLKRELHVGFSGGEKKLSEVLQMALLEPEFAFLDEIDSGVDVDSLKKVFSAIVRLTKKGTGFLLVTHATKILDYIKPDAVYIMKEGRIKKTGGYELMEEIEEKGFNM